MSAWKTVARLSAVALLSCSGCAVSNHYQRPVMDLPAEWKWTGKDADRSAAAPAMKPAEPAAPVAAPGPEWWRIFKDDKLNELETQAAASNQDLRAAVGRVDEARASLRGRRADFYPQISTNPSYSRQENSGNTFIPGFSGGNIPGLRNPYNTFTLPLSLSYEVDVFGRVRNASAAAAERAEAAVADYQAVQLAVQAELASDYFTLRALDAQMDVLQRSLKLQNEALELVNARFKFGTVDATDTARARADLATTRASVASVKRQREQISNAVAILCGQPATAFTLDVKPLKEAPPEIPAGIPSALLERRPDIVRGERNLVAACHDIAVARTAFYPRFSLTASGGFESTQLTNFLNGPSSLWSIAGNLVQPIFTGGKNKADLEAARARAVEAEAAYHQQVLTAFGEVENALVEIRYRAEEGQALDEAVSAAKQTTQLALERYRSGLTSNFEFVDAQRRNLEVEQQAADNLGQRLAAAVRLVRALGGAW